MIVLLGQKNGSNNHKPTWLTDFRSFEAIKNRESASKHIMILFSLIFPYQLLDSFCTTIYGKF